MKISHEREERALVAQVTGRIDGSNALEFEKALKDIISDDDRAVILDFDELSYISSAGLRVILLIAKTLRKKETKFAICALSDPISEVFQISGFDQIISIHANRTEALTNQLA